MRSSEASILIIAGHSGAGEAHWQSRMAAKLPSAEFVQQDDWTYGSLPRASRAVAAAVQAAEKPVVFVGHSAGCILIAHAVGVLREQAVLHKVAGAYLVVPPADGELAKAGLVMDAALHNVPRDPLPFPSMLIASSDDPHASLEASAELAAAWGSDFVEAGPQGHINVASGHGPWPEGMLKFAGFLKRLG